jgi:glycine C-acetyltransferase
MDPIKPLPRIDHVVTDSAERDRGSDGADLAPLDSHTRPVTREEPVRTAPLAPRLPSLGDFPPSFVPRPQSDAPPSITSRTMSSAPPSFVARPMTMPPLETPLDDDELGLDDMFVPLPPEGEPEAAPELRVRGVPVQDLPVAALTGHFGLFQRARGRDLLERPTEFFAWYKSRLDAGLWPFCRRFESQIGPAAKIRAEDGILTEGLNFAAHDYLSLATHPEVHEAARRALHDFGPIAGGSPVLAGNTSLSEKAERAVSELTKMEHVLLFTSGWTAGFGAITALIREHDHIVMDVYSHASLQQGAMAATRKIARFRHCDNESARRQIRKARTVDPDGCILVITETLFSMDSDSTRIAELQAICREYDATLLVDCAHDLGALGPGGTGRLGIEKMLGKVDLLVGCFSKSFATGGGFLATHHEKVRLYIRAYGGPYLFSTGISPIQTGVALASLGISASAEGEGLRARLMENAVLLRSELTARGQTCIGEPSALIPVLVGDEGVARIAYALAAERGILCNLVEYPAVAVGMARFRLQVQPLHTHEQVKTAARVVDESIRAAQAASSSLPKREMEHGTMPPPSMQLGTIPPMSAAPNARRF